MTISSTGVNVNNDLGVSGNVGIGVAPATYKLNVNGSLNATSLFLNGTAFTGGSRWSLIPSTTNIFYNSGNVGIGTTSTANANVKLQVGAGGAGGAELGGRADAPRYWLGVAHVLLWAEAVKRRMWSCQRSAVCRLPVLRPRQAVAVRRLFRRQRIDRVPQHAGWSWDRVEEHCGIGPQVPASEGGNVADADKATHS